jgi:hypothetical protein
MWESSQVSLLEISLRTNVKGNFRFPQEVLLSNQAKIINFLFDIGSHYLSRSWHDWTFPLRLPKNVAELPVLHN